jgi:pimeloyl-ACP methyl ester carboxylesterase
MDEVMKKFICNVLVIICSLSLSMFVLDYTCENNAIGAENKVFQIPEQFLSQKAEWEKCEFIETKKRVRKAECANITVPLDWENPEGDTITIYVKRLKSLLRATKQVWLLAGGPSGAGTVIFPQYIQPITQLDWRLDLYTLDHRGTGNSNRLSCPDQETDESEEGIWLTENEGAACIEHLEANYNLDAFTVTQAAKDVGYLVDLLKEDNKEIFVYGYSYGTYWGHRYAQIFPGQADGMILDAVLPAVGFEADQVEVLGNDVAKDLFDICKEDGFCRSKLGDDPWGKANAILEKFKDGHCAELVENGLTLADLQTLAFRALDNWAFRILLPALYYRIDRCSKKDVRAFKWLLDIFIPLFPPPNTRSFSEALRYHIILSELISDNPISAEEMEDIDKTLLASQHLSCRCLRHLEKWPTYATDEYYRKWASQDVPMLILHGTLDQRIPLAMANNAKKNLTGPKQYFVEAQNANHVTMFRAPVKNLFAPHCGMQIVVDYMEDPLKEPDTSCLDDLSQIDFRGNPFMSLLVFGAWDLWGK